MDSTSTEESPKKDQKEIRYKIALCLSGHFRTFSLCSTSLFDNFISEYKPDIFIHTWDNLGFGTNGTKTTKLKSQNDLSIVDKNSLYGNSKLEFYRNSPNLDDIYKCLNPIEIVIEKYEDIEKDILELSNDIKNKSNYDYPVNTISMWRKRYLCNEVKQKYEINNNFKYDIVVTTRPDILYTNKLFFNFNDINKIKTPLYQSYNIISDLFAYSSSDKMDIYCSLYKKIKEYKERDVSFNPHFLLLNHLKEENIEFVIDSKISIEINKNNNLLGF